MKSLMARWILGLVMLFTFAAVSQAADAQVVVKIGSTHRHYYHDRYYYRHVYYRHGHRYYGYYR